ncbi:MAG: geranylgeranyl reductase family protein [Gemmatimonadales bacterium]|nr:geranylgeranyl reductase family protein [Gemmatimonadales bacterium]
MRGDWDAVIAGAGPAGSTTAMLLARAGARVLLLDRARFPRDKPCSEYLSPQTTSVLARLGDGVLEEVAAAAPARLNGMQIVAPSGVAATGRFLTFSYALPRTRFDLILRRAAERAGAEVREGIKVEELVSDGERISGVIATRMGAGSREQYRAPVVVGADGLHSIVARRLGLVRHSYPRRVAFTAHVSDARDVIDMGEMHVGDTGAYVGLGPIGDGLTTVALVVPARHAAAHRGVDHFFDALAHFPRLAGRFDRRRLVRGLLATGPFAQWSHRPVAPEGGALLVGDAADFFDPFTGQGIYSALRGAELAAATLIGDKPLAAYARARRREFTGKWLLERLIAIGIGWPALAERAIRRLARRPELADLFVRATGNTIPARRALSPAVLARVLL